MAAKQKMTHYDNLVEKLYQFLEEKVREKELYEEDKYASIALEGYEKKMIGLSDEILVLKDKL